MSLISDTACMVRDGRNSVVNRVNRVLILYYTTFNVRDRLSISGNIRDK